MSGRHLPEEFTSSAKPSLRRCGFTLVELLIVITIIAIAAAIAMPMLGETDSTRLTSAARLLVADLDFAKMESITHADDPRVVVFNQGTHSYHIAASSAPSTPITNIIANEPYVVQFGTGRAAKLTGVTIQSYSLDGDSQLEFGSFGQLDQATTATVTLQAGSATVTVQIDPISGEASVN